MKTEAPKAEISPAILNMRDSGRARRSVARSTAIKLASVGVLDLDLDLDLNRKSCWRLRL
jgi:hypothetical protein